MAALALREAALAALAAASRVVAVVAALMHGGMAVGGGRRSAAVGARLAGTIVSRSRSHRVAGANTASRHVATTALAVAVGWAIGAPGREVAGVSPGRLPSQLIGRMSMAVRIGSWSGCVMLSVSGRSVWSSGGLRWRRSSTLSAPQRSSDPQRCVTKDHDQTIR